ncbi:carbohydrate ABC transporter permease [Prochlorothrix hollandica]|uniref:ABC transporter n=1 Tax=Prochlorothrix hollandica PCC 9006 = CALU 1027 TaxID=317619 RepID=A0A0M2PWV8_PROHO|nr:sugar ABC transporter permease [Prochlorothrix hollandica]KKI99577.1 ABC transporter [Prochlorothrix hollandica PCC 9006 = CALU 1027]
MASDNLTLVGQALLTLGVGCGGMVALFYGLNRGVERLPDPWRSRLLPWVYLSPALGVLLAYLVLPTLNTLYLSVLDRSSSQFVGLSNYQFAFSDRAMVSAFGNNLVWLGVVTSVSVGLGLGLAVMVDRVRYETLIKTTIFLPMAISFVGSSVIWKFIYDFRPQGFPQIGLLNGIITQIGLDPVGWLVIRPWNNLALMVIMIWLQTGFCMVLLSAAIKGIPSDILDAARIDGSTEWQIFWRIIVPMTRSTLLVVATTVIVAVLKVFDIVFVMTGGNLGTEVIASRMIKEMFNYRNFGHGSAIAVILLLAVIPVMVTNIRRFQQQESA